LAPTSVVAQPVVYTWGLVASDVPNRLYAFHGDLLIRSSDAGCTSSTVAEVRGWETPPKLGTGPGDRVYGWSDNGSFFFRLLEDDTVLILRAPVTNMAGVAVNPHDGLHLSLAGTDGGVFESFNGGLNWTFIDTAQPAAQWFYRFEFDPNDLDHIVAGGVVTGAWTSFDGGRRFKQAEGLGERYNVFSIEISPVDGNVVWARAIDTKIYDDPFTPVRHVFRSTDGGKSFTRVLTDSPELTLTNQPLMVPHPTDSNVVYFVFGTFFQEYGTEIYRYDAALQRLTRTTNAYDEIGSIVFNPGDPSVMYLGIIEER
jgi:hypothetical protein